MIKKKILVWIQNKNPDLAELNVAASGDSWALL